MQACIRIDKREASEQWTFTPVSLFHEQKHFGGQKEKANWKGCLCFVILLLLNSSFFLAACVLAVLMKFVFVSFLVTLCFVCLSVFSACFSSLLIHLNVEHVVFPSLNSFFFKHPSCVFLYYPV